MSPPDLSPYGRPARPARPVPEAADAGQAVEAPSRRPADPLPTLVEALATPAEPLRTSSEAGPPPVRETPPVVAAISPPALEAPPVVPVDRTPSVAAPVAQPVPASAPPATPTDAVTITVDRFSAIGAAVGAAVIAGCLGPWITLGPFSRSGIDGASDAWFVLAAGILGALLVATRRSRVLTLITGLIVAGVAAVDGADISSRGNDLIAPSPGWGLYLVGLAGLVLIGSAFARRGPRTPSAPGMSGRREPTADLADLVDA